MKAGRQKEAYEYSIHIQVYVPGIITASIGTPMAKASDSLCESDTLILRDTGIFILDVYIV